MAKFSPPWASVGGVVRSPTVDEQADGFECGPADLELFNRKLQGYDGELQAILDEGSITGSEGDDTGVLQAILNIIAAVTGEADTSGYVLFSQAQARLPIFPEVTTNNGVITVTAPSTGTVRVPASAIILHRGIRPYTTAETDLSTSSSKTYHLRFQVTAGVGAFVLKDLADTGYNPTVATEANEAFDSTYDDMLVARVVTNSSNVATITNLVNKDRMSISGETEQGRDAPFQDGASAAGLNGRTLTFDLARRPKVAISALTDIDTTRNGITEFNIGIRVNSRYNATYWYQNDGTNPALDQARFSYEVWA